MKSLNHYPNQRGSLLPFGVRAYSMPELLLVVSIIGIISALSYPVVRNFAAANDLAEAESKAEALTVAKILFYRSDSLASGKWEAAKKNDSKFELVKSYLFDVASSESTLAEYTAAPPYDVFDMGVTIKDPVYVINPHDNDGHGNNEDGVDVSNPGQGGGGPTGADDPSGDVDDEK